MSKMSASGVDNDFQSKLVQLNRQVESCREQANRNGEQFNIFAILGMQRDEARTHSRFLAELLNPNGRHGSGIRFLEAFITDLLQLNSPVSTPVRVTRELATREGRRFDIVVDTPERLIGIEVKVDAADQHAQLADYYAELEHLAQGRKEFTLVYLTLDGKTPSANSLNGLDTQKVLCLSFAHDIRTWLNTCHTLGSHKPELAHGILQYRRLIESLTGTGLSMTSLIAEQLAHNKDDLRTALEAAAALPKAKTRVMLDFWELLQVQLKQALGAAPEVYNSKNLKTLSREYCHGKRDSKHVGLRFPIGHLNDKVLCLYINLYHAIHYGLRLENAPGIPVACRDTRTIFRQHLNDGNAIADANDDWLVCYYHDPAQQPTVLDFHTFNDTVLELVDVERRQELVGMMVQHQVKLIAQAKAVFNSDWQTSSVTP